MPTSTDFVKAIYSEWGSGVTGTLSAPLFVWAAVARSGVPRIAAGSLAVICLYVAAYRVWKREHNERTKAEEKLSACADIRGTIWGTILQHNPLQDQAKDGSGLRFKCPRRCKTAAVLPVYQTSAVDFWEA